MACKTLMIEWMNDWLNDWLCVVCVCVCVCVCACVRVCVCAYDYLFTLKVSVIVPSLPFLWLNSWAEEVAGVGRKSHKRRPSVTEMTHNSLCHVHWQSNRSLKTDSNLVHQWSGECQTLVCMHCRQRVTLSCAFNYIRLMWFLVLINYMTY